MYRHVSLYVLSRYWLLFSAVARFGPLLGQREFMICCIFFLFVNFELLFSRFAIPLYCEGVRVLTIAGLDCWRI